MQFLCNLRLRKMVFFSQSTDIFVTISSPVLQYRFFCPVWIAVIQNVDSLKTDEKQRKITLFRRYLKNDARKKSAETQKADGPFIAKKIFMKRACRREDGQKRKKGESCRKTKK